MKYTNCAAWFNETDATPPVPSVHYIVSKSGHYFEAEWNPINESWRWREISREDFKLLTMSHARTPEWTALFATTTTTTTTTDATPADLPILTETASAAYEILLQQPTYRGLTGTQLLELMDKKGYPSDQSTLTGRIVPELKPYGIENTRRKGYRIPASKRPQS